MLRTIFLALWQLMYMAVRMPQIWQIKSLRRQGRLAEAQQILDEKVPQWPKKLFRVIGLNLKVEGEENLPPKGETVLFVSNHQSYLDIPIFLSDLGGPHAIMAKKELGRIPFLGSWIRALDCVLVERADIRAAAAAMKEGEALLSSGHSLIICPEGTRSQSGVMGTFKAGSVRMAIRTGVPLQPIAIDGSYKALEGNRYRVKKADVRMIILPKVEVTGLDKAAQKALPGQLQAMIQAALDSGK